MRPDLFAAVVAMVPFVDTLNTMLDATLPLTVGEYEEFGNPQRESNITTTSNPMRRMRTSRPSQYPTMLVTAGSERSARVLLGAGQVGREAASARRPAIIVLLLKTNMGSGHFGASGRYEGIKETAFDYAFLLRFHFPAGDL